jgi:hypothetical protein
MTDYLEDPSMDGELRKGQTVFLEVEGVEDSTPYIVTDIGSTMTPYDYIVQSPRGFQRRITVEDVEETDHKVILKGAKLIPEATELSIRTQPVQEEYELINTTAARVNQYVVVNIDGKEKTLPVVLWGTYYRHLVPSNGVQIGITETVLLPLVAIPNKLELERVTPEMFLRHNIG